MVSLMETLQPSPPSIDQPSSPRISFSADFLDDNNNFITISPKPLHTSEKPQPENSPSKPHSKPKPKPSDFEFLSNTTPNTHAAMLTADELFFEGKLLPFWQTQQSDKLHKINLKAEEKEDQVVKLEEQRVWFVDDDPSPRPPKCTVLWKELLRLKKQRANSSLSPSSSSSSTSSSSSSLGDAAVAEEGCKKMEQKQGKRVKKGLERTRSATIRIRPMINVPICTQMKSSALPPLFPIRKGR
ncbi:hypothetical protein M5689_005731 [Euphorbia peplus]|nr:hypothetical protein M5689_005731 [Euphorbia peplus]